MKKVKVLKNFACNGIKKKVGEYLSEAEKDKIGKKFGKELIFKDFLLVEGSVSAEDSGMATDDNGVTGDDEDADDTQHIDENEDDGLGDMNKEDLVQYAKDIGLKPHHKHGEEKIKKMIREKLNS